MRGRESLQVPIRGRVGLLEAVIRQERQGRALETSRHDDNVCFDEFFVAWAALGHALSTSINNDALFFDILDISTNPLRVTTSEFVHDVGVDHGSVREETHVRRGNMGKVSVEEPA